MSLIKVLKTAPGLYNKQRILRSANETDKKIFKYAYDKSLTFGVSFDYIDWSTVKDDTSVMLFEILDALANRTLTGSAARSVVERHASTHGDLIKLICNKDLDCGIAAGMLESVFGKTLVNKFAVQLAKEVPLNKLKYPLMAQIKYDGVRVVVMKENNVVTFYTRNGKQFKCPVLEKQILSIPRYNLVDNYILDGELIQSCGESGKAIEARTSIAGRVNSAIHGGILNGSDLQFVIFDYMTLEHFKAQHCPWSYDIRLDDLTKQLYSAHIESYPNLFIAHSKEVTSVEDANNYYTDIASEGYEGIILKSAKHKYTFKRSADWVKVKAIKSADLLCSDVVEGSGKYAGMVGALVCFGLVDGKNVIVKVGSGLTDSDRTEHFNTYIGKKIEVKYNDIIKDSKTGQWSLFLPRFVTIRGDL